MCMLNVYILYVSSMFSLHRDSDLSNTRSPVTAGSDVYVRGTPFGDHCLRLFMNSTLVGCVCLSLTVSYQWDVKVLRYM